MVHIDLTNLGTLRRDIKGWYTTKRGSGVKTIRKISIRCLIILVLVITFIEGYGYFNTNQIRKYIEYCDSIYEVIKCENFETAKVYDGEIILLDDNKKEVKRINTYIKQMYNIKYIENHETNMRFWNRGFDDLSGLMYVKDEWDRSIMDGLNSIERCGPSLYDVYYVSTQTRF